MSAVALVVRYMADSGAGHRGKWVAATRCREKGELSHRYSRMRKDVVKQIDTFGEISNVVQWHSEVVGKPARTFDTFGRFAISDNSLISSLTAPTDKPTA